MLLYNMHDTDYNYICDWICETPHTHINSFHNQSIVLPINSFIDKPTNQQIPLPKVNRSVFTGTAF